MEELLEILKYQRKEVLHWLILELMRADAISFTDIIKKLCDFYRDYDTVSHLIDVKEELANLFPELVESEDEKVRKALIEMVHDTTGDELWIDYNVHKEDALAWLKKQGKEDLSIQQAYEWGYTEGKRIERKHWIEKQKISEDYNSIDPQFGKPIEQNPVWSEEDDGMFDTMEGWLDTLCEYLNDSSSECIPNVESCINWFKSLKERFLPQPKQDWTEEDEHRAEDTIYFLDTAKKHYASTVELDACIDWLKAIKDRYSWKPSSELDETSYQVGIKRVLENPESYGLTKYNWKPGDKQMHAFEQVYDWYNNNFAPSETLTSLYKDLEKLKGE